MSKSDFVEIFEVGPRDGLQNEARLIPAGDKIALIDMLSRSGLRRIEATSFVSPRWVPQMADAAEVMAGITRAPGVAYAVLTPNMQGLTAAIAAGADEVAIFAAASEGFSRANLNAGTAEVLDRLAPVAAGAIAAGLRLRGYVSVVTDCPFDGPVPPARVAAAAAALSAMGCAEISLGETLGRGRPEAVDAMLRAVLAEVPPRQLAGHFHDTGGQALANVDVALGHGLRVFDSAVGGLGGCPYAPGAAGNLATERLMAHLAVTGWTTELDPHLIDQAAAFAQRLRLH